MAFKAVDRHLSESAVVRMSSYSFIAFGKSFRDSWDSPRGYRTQWSTHWAHSGTSFPKYWVIFKKSLYLCFKNNSVESCAAKQFIKGSTTRARSSEGPSKHETQFKILMNLQKLINIAEMCFRTKKMDDYLMQESDHLYVIQDRTDFPNGFQILI